MQLNAKQAHAFKQIASGKNVFLTGPGGVGKSVLIRKIRDTFPNDTIFIAPTGIAAQNISGSTIHRTFGLKIGFLGSYQRKQVSKRVESLFGDDTVKRIVIDEVSVARADTFTAIDEMLRRVKRKNIPFGGIQIVVVGDFYQLSPVLNDRSPEARYFYEEFESPFAFDTDSWRNAGFETIMLTDVMRQSDKFFIDALNSIRVKDSNYANSLNALNQIGNKELEIEDTIYLCSTNKDADMINDHHFQDIVGEEKCYRGVIDGSFKDMIVPTELNLKVGCKVMICANSPEEDYFNGQTGRVHELFSNSVSVLIDGEVTPTIVSMHKWEELEYNNLDGELSQSVAGTYTQIPLKLGYAVTIHKSQGLSLDSAVIYTGRGCFAHGQAYVALSRLRSVEGLYMINPIGLNEIIVDKRVHEFYERNKFSNLLNT